MSLTAYAAALNEHLAQSLGRGHPLCQHDRARIAAAFLAIARQGRSPLVIFPAVQEMNWAAVKRDPSRSLLILNDVIRAYEFCARGVPAIAILGASRGWVRKWLQDRGASVKDQRNMN